MLAIHSTREEISIMRLVAHKYVHRGPYIVQGIFYGLIAGILSIVFIAPLIYFQLLYKNGNPEVNIWTSNSNLFP